MTVPQMHVTTGVFRVPDLPAAIGPAVLVMVRSFLPSGTTAEVAFTVHRIEPDGTKTPIHDGNLAVPGGGGADRAILKVWQVEGQFIEVTMDLPFAGLKPSVAVITSFLADDSTQLELWISPADFSDRRRSP